MSQFWKPGTDRAQQCLLDDEEGGVLFLSALPTYSSHDYSNLERQRQRLPVFKYRTAILYLVENHATTIIVGETGSGKTTQIPQYLKEAGWAEGGRVIACTQPRRLAVQSVASRVAEEMGAKVGEEVGYTIRFEDKTVQGVTKIKFLTDGILLREMMDDPLLTKYSVIMVDEAHERSISTDMLLGLLKKIQRRRPELRLVISSATIEAKSMSNFFRTRLEEVHCCRCRQNVLWVEDCNKLMMPTRPVRSMMKTTPHKVTLDFVAISYYFSLKLVYKIFLNHILQLSFVLPSFIKARIEVLD